MGGFLGGPVAITGAGGHVGGVLSRRLAELPNEVRALGRRDDVANALPEVDRSTLTFLVRTRTPRRAGAGGEGESRSRFLSVGRVGSTGTHAQLPPHARVRVRSRRGG